jgi:hypothetical protein
MKATLLVIAVIVGVVVLSALLLSPFIWLLNDYLRHRLKKELKQDIIDSVINSQLSWKDLQVFWEDTAELRQSDVTMVLKLVLRDAYTGKSDNLKQHEDLIKSYIEESQAADPLAGLPDEVKVSFERLFAKPQIGKQDLLPLVLQLRTLSKLYRQNSILKTCVSVIVAIVTLIGAFFAI